MDERTKSSGIFNETPLPHDRHPVNYISYIGNVMSKFRRSHQRDLRGCTSFGKEILGPYLGVDVDRNRIARAEKGDPTVAFGVYAAYFAEMGVLPEIIRAIEKGDTSNLRYLILVERELNHEIEDAIDAGGEKLSARSALEKKVDE